MKNKTIEESNKLIAEFMGATWEFQEIIYQSYGWKFEKERPTKHSSMWHGTEGLLYHDSWDWLMPVVEKIEEETDYHFKIDNNEVELYSIAHDKIVTYKQVFTTKTEDHKIQSVWYAVVEFIQWYNTQTNQTEDAKYKIVRILPFERIKDIATRDRKTTLYCQTCGLENTVTIKAGINKYWISNHLECWNCNKSLTQC